MSTLPEHASALQALRASGDWRIDPVRFHALEALARRLPQQPEAVRALLEGKLQSGLAAFVAQVEQGRAAVGPKTTREAGVPSPLAQLNAALREARPQAELASAQRFRQSWQRQRTLEQVDLALARKPANAGPLNSHALVVQTLEWMRALSPDYVRHFVGYVETLQWLEDAAAAPREQAKGKKAGTRSARKPRS